MQSSSDAQSLLQTLLDQVTNTEEEASAAAVCRDSWQGNLKALAWSSCDSQARAAYPYPPILSGLNHGRRLQSEDGLKIARKAKLAMQNADKNCPRNVLFSLNTRGLKRQVRTARRVKRKLCEHGLAFLENLVGPPTQRVRKPPNQTETRCQNSKTFKNLQKYTLYPQSKPYFPPK